ncbi:MAG: ATP-dependent RecD-like DNA helicase [Bacilli bacterium]|nr:ATP-dependent RecD-like DNA helicase [Bacilli bacterium]
MKTYIKGTYKGSIFESDNNYVIGLFRIKDTNDENMKNYINKTITFTGYFLELNKEDTYFFYGEEVNHPKYGFQYNVKEYERIKPDDIDGIAQFLSSDLFSGVGEKLAKKIVDVLGENTLDKILDNPSCLMLVPKISKKKADTIYETLKKYEESHKTICYLTELGFNMKDSLNIYNTYLSNTIQIIEHNIYKIIDDIDNISFLKVDEIANKLNITGSDERRIEACIIYIMKELTFNFGDTYLKYEDIKRRVNKYLMLDIADVDFYLYLNTLKDEDKIVIEDDKYYLINMYEAEINISNKFKILLNKPHYNYQELDDKITKLEEENNIKYNELQKEAIKSALNNNISIITGGPGTGKTTIVKAIVNLYKDLHKLSDSKLIEQIALLAPTGRASKRMSESTLIPSFTIHRFLKWNKELNEFSINEYNKDKSKFIIVDEVSMIDIELMDNLLKGLTDNIQLILVGDYDQLPSVGPGNILKDLIESKKINTIKLDQLYRQNNNSYITTLAHEIKENDLSINFTEPRSDYQFLACSANHIRENIKKIALLIKEKDYDYKKVQFMAPMYKGENGIDTLNKDLQEIFNPRNPNKVEYNYGDVIFRENDKVLQLVNMPDNNIYNGDIGVIKAIVLSNVSKKTEIYVDFDSNIVKYNPKDLVNIKHAYVISIHKSQGSEFDLVVIPICYSYKRMLYKNLIYTGITRAKKKLILVGEPNTFSSSIKQVESHKRETTLKEKMYNL